MEEILIVEDDKDIQKLLSICLEQEGLPFSIVSSGLDAIERVKKKVPNLILLDIMLPDMNGMEVCEQIRFLTSAPIVFLSCNNKDSDKILGLSLGGDDYIEKPFSTSVLMARIRAHLRRNRVIQKQKTNTRQICFDNIVIDTSSRELFRNGEVIELTNKEFDLISFFSQHPNQVFSPEQLLDKIWSIDSFSEKRTVIVHISSLRKKVEEDPLNPKYIVTLRGAGYKFAGYQNG
ncbi:response regulator transcription factor [Paenibacillus alginolyticus]|uniref:Response regulator transcription factor n=1 Tax=Paenibacillus alginolyticus TaxID=59839 RepID=A0ABT4GAJ1_9BACL|nr:response regulator transcription factor [Paenibacillus alginolyticus]MCY9693215.1 response regulator transcription factor [Paenibacillus alginolyticus]MEC0146016.1 response regulator transcription factor [Paenibacillus alginolyticus]